MNENKEKNDEFTGGCLMAAIGLFVFAALISALSGVFGQEGIDTDIFKGLFVAIVILGGIVFWRKNRNQD